ncbi:hypothetical protein [Thermus caldilimi]|uniref:hypothetical protein n=1 Tax=Thermus caldilimi TaxID=2483360 RepID=UPI001076A271|nr:hypothetical protein [Thermus caldilimi]
MLEILVSRGVPLTLEEREVLRREAEAIFQEVLGTSPERLRVLVLEEAVQPQPLGECRGGEG